MTIMAKSLLRRNSLRKTPSTPSSSSSTNTAICSSLLKQVFLHEWWLIKADSDSHGRQLGIGGFTSKENQGIRSFLSAPVVKRHDAVTLKTVDGVTIMVHGHLNRSRTLENGFSQEVCNHFVIGFPYYWEEFAALSADGEAAQFSVSKGISGSDAYETPTLGDHGSNMPSRKIFDDILQQNNGDAFQCSGASNAKEESSRRIKATISTPDETPLNRKKTKAERRRRRGDIDVEYVEHSGPLTRSRTRLLDK